LPDPPPVQAIGFEIDGNIGELELGFSNALLPALESFDLT
jgi:hypothetical protein